METKNYQRSLRQSANYVVFEKILGGPWPPSGSASGLDYIISL